jgi:hypothetical protein
MVVVGTAMETVATGAVMTDIGTPTSAPDIGTDGIAFATAIGAAMTAMGTATSAASAARTAWCFRQGVAHIVQYLPSLLETAHTPHSQSRAEAGGGGQNRKVVRAGCEGCVCWLCVCCTPLLFC